MHTAMFLEFFLKKLIFMCNLGLHIKIFMYNLESKSCLGFLVCMACVENMATMVFGENKKCESEACNTQLLTHYDVHGHVNPKKIIKSFKNMVMKRWWTPLIKT